MVLPVRAAPGSGLDHMRNLARQGFELALEGLAVFKQSVLGMIHLSRSSRMPMRSSAIRLRFASLASWRRP